MTIVQQDTSRLQKYNQERIAFWDSVARKKRTHGVASYAYYQRLKEIYRFHISPGLRVLEIGCGEGELLAGVQPGYGVGVDFSPAMLARAEQRHPELHFVLADGLTFSAAEPFDVIILSDLLNDSWDIQALFENLRKVCHSRTRILINFYSRLWSPVLNLAGRLGLAQEPLEQNWVTDDDVIGLLDLAGFGVVKNTEEVLLPLPIPLLRRFCDEFLVRLWPFRSLALTNFIIARPLPDGKALSESALPSVTVVVPARNEAGNVVNIIEQLPQMGSFTELMFVEGNSSDDTYAEIERQMALHPQVDCRLFKQSGKGKGDAVRLGFQEAKGDILMILDADLTVPPEYLPRFYDALVLGKGEFINGVRLVYPMEKQAMRPANFLGNKFFSLAFSWLLGQPVKDTLCGTKVLTKADYLKIVQNRAYFGDFDPFGDFDLLFGASKLNLSIVDMPVRYAERVYGSTNIQRWKHGWLLLKMVVFAAFRVKFK